MDVIVGRDQLSFLNTYLGYNQIPMFSPDLANTAFLTPRGMYCYNVMPFAIKNERATYQRMMSRMFEPRLGKTMEAYIDYMMVKLESRNDHLTYPREAFQLMRL